MRSEHGQVRKLGHATTRKFYDLGARAYPEGLDEDTFE